MTDDPVETNPAHYRVLFENARVRVLAYEDVPGDHTTQHSHPDSVMVTKSAFRRRLTRDGATLETELPDGAAFWLPAQSHYGENIGETPTSVLFIELLEPEPVGSGRGAEPLGPDQS